jgi:selenophosphate synthetase-related protein
VDAAVFDLEDAGGEAVDEVAVVRDEEHRAGEVADGVEQDVLGAQIEVVGGLVEQQQVRGETSIFAIA